MRLFLSFLLGLFAYLPVWCAVPATSEDESSHPNPQLRWVRSLPPVIKQPISASDSNNLAIKVEQQSGGSDISRIPDPLLPSIQPSKNKAWLVKDSVPRQWTVEISDKTLYRTMRRWAQEANYQLLWQVDRDYPIEVGVVFEDTLRQAVEEVMAGVALTDYPIQAIFNSSARVLRVVRLLGDERQ